MADSDAQPEPQNQQVAAEGTGVHIGDKKEDAADDTGERAGDKDESPELQAQKLDAGSELQKAAVLSEEAKAATALSTDGLDGEIPGQVESPCSQVADTSLRSKEPLKLAQDDSCAPKTINEPTLASGNADTVAQAEEASIKGGPVEQGVSAEVPQSSPLVPAPAKESTLKAPATLPLKTQDQVPAKESIIKAPAHLPAKTQTQTAGSPPSPGAAAQPLLTNATEGESSVAAPDLDRPVVVSYEEVSQAVEEIRQKGADMVEQGSKVASSVRQKGAEAVTMVQQQGVQIAEAAHVARQRGAEVLNQGAEAAQTMQQRGAEVLQHGAEAARGVRQRGAEVAEAAHTQWQEAAAAWRRAAPKVDLANLGVNVASAMVVAGFIMLGMILVLTPLEAAEHGAFDRMFWLTQGLYLVGFSIPPLIAIVQKGVLRKGFDSWPSELHVEKWIGIMKYQIGRAVFLLFAGFYVFPLMSNFNHVAKVDSKSVALSYFLGVMSLLAGVLLIVFDVLLWIYVRQGIYEPVPLNLPEQAA